MRRSVLAILLAAGLACGTGPARAACPSDADVAQFAANLVTRVPNPPPAGLETLEDGLCAQAKLVAALTELYGPPVGYKLALTAEASQRLFGVAHPVRGVLFSSVISLNSGAVLPLAFAAIPAVEADFLVRVRDEGINDAGADHLEILRHLDAVIPFIELPDLSVQGRMTAPMLLAINAGARLGVVGEPVPVEATQAFADRLAQMTVTFTDDTGHQIARLPGSAVLGHPLNAVAYLIADLARTGNRLRAGDILSIAGFSAPTPPAAGRTYTVVYEGLAPTPVSVSVTIR